MQDKIRITSLFITILVAGVLLGLPAFADDDSDLLQEFLDVQGSNSTFVPPVGDYVGWANGGFILFALVDYAGVADAWIQSQTDESIGTEIEGEVKIKDLSDEMVRIRVELKTEDALAWGFKIADADFENDPLPFLNTPLLFGKRAQDVVEMGAEPDTVDTRFKIVFVQKAGAPFPDLVELFFAEPSEEQYLVKYKFTAHGDVTLADGDQEAELLVVQSCKGGTVSSLCTGGLEIIKLDIEDDEDDDDDDD